MAVVYIGSILFVTKHAIGHNPTVVLPTSHHQINLIKNALYINHGKKNLKKTILLLLYSVSQ